jgi:hypothetical protein
MSKLPCFRKTVKYFVMPLSPKTRMILFIALRLLPSVLGVFDLLFLRQLATQFLRTWENRLWKNFMNIAAWNSSG